MGPGLRPWSLERGLLKYPVYATLLPQTGLSDGRDTMLREKRENQAGKDIDFSSLQGSELSYQLDLLLPEELKDLLLFLAESGMVERYGLTKFPDYLKEVGYGSLAETYREYQSGKEDKKQETEKDFS